MTNPTRIVSFGLALIAVLLMTALVYADESVYVSAAIGSTSLDESTDFPIDDDATAFRLGLGYSFGNDIALEANYVNLGEFTGNTGFNNNGISGEVDGLALSAVFTLPLTNSLSATARGGIMAWESEITTPAFRQKRDGDDVFYGLGLEASFTENFVITGEWQRYELDDSEADVLFIGARFTF